MRINKFIAASTGMSRRAADTAISNGSVSVNGRSPLAGHDVVDSDKVIYDGQRLSLLQKQTIMFHKPAGYITSRDGQGNKTIYNILPQEFGHLKPVGRLDKYTSGLLLLSNDGELTQQLTHPSNHKVKVYQVRIDKDLAPLHRQMISDMGIQLDDGPSKFQLGRLEDGNEKGWQVTMHEGRNRQIRRTFEALGYKVIKLHRSQFGTYQLGTLDLGHYKDL